jgi:hypothetical protein
MGQFVVFDMYYLRFLTDECHFIIDDIDEISLWSKSLKYGEFINSTFQDRINAKSKDENQLYKIMLNSSYGADGWNYDKFKVYRFLNEKDALKAQAPYRHRSTRKINENLYLVEMKKQSSKASKALQGAFATLQHAKYLFILFIEKFIKTCLDETKWHFNYCDTDSYYFAISGDVKKGVEQGFSAIVKNQELYDEKVKLWFPSEKKLMTLSEENSCTDMICLSAKCYSMFNNEKSKVKCKGISISGDNNKNLNYEAFKKFMYDGKTCESSNCVLRLKNKKMTKQIISKSALSGVNTKSVVLKNGCCCPYIYGLSSANYHVK